LVLVENSRLIPVPVTMPDRNDQGRAIALLPMDYR
jgi:hypothetical protein